MKKSSTPMKLILAFATLLILSFQNCSGTGILNAGFFSGKSSPGNGSGYEGINQPAGPGNGQIQVGLFLLYVEDGGCSGGREKSVIRFSKDVYKIERLECEDILPAQVLPASQITLDNHDPLVLYYGGRTFRQR